MAKFKVVTQKPAGVTFDLADSQFTLERQSLDPIDAEIVVVDANSEEEFIAGAKDADALIARNRKITRNIIQSLDKQLTLEDIARSRKITLSELLTEMETVVESGTKISLEHIINEMKKALQDF